MQRIRSTERLNDGVKVTPGSYGRVIGSGAFASVLVLNGWPKTAAKFIRLNGTAYHETQFANEWQVLKRLHHPNIIAFYGMDEIQMADGLYHVIEMEYCERDSLRSIIFDPKIIYIIRTVHAWAKQMFSVLKYLRENQLSHRDLKPENVLVNANFVLKVADFGCVKDLQIRVAPSIAGTYLYMSPELIRGRSGQMPALSYKSDLYAVGLILWELVERRFVHQHYGGCNFRDVEFVLDLEKGKAQMDDPPDCDEILKEIIMSCIQINENERASIVNVYPRIVELNRGYTYPQIKPIEDPEQSVPLKPYLLIPQPLPTPPSTVRPVNEEPEDRRPHITIDTITPNQNEVTSPINGMRAEDITETIKHPIIPSSPSSTDSSGSESSKKIHPVIQIPPVNEGPSGAQQCQNYTKLINFLQKNTKLSKLLGLVNERYNLLEENRKSYVFSLDSFLNSKNQNLPPCPGGIIQNPGLPVKMITMIKDHDESIEIMKLLTCWTEQRMDDLIEIYETVSEAFRCIENGMVSEYPGVIRKFAALNKNPFFGWKIPLMTYKENGIDWCLLSREERVFVKPTLMEITKRSKGEWIDLNLIHKSVGLFGTPIMTYCDSKTHTIDLGHLCQTLQKLYNAKS